MCMLNFEMHVGYSCGNTQQVEDRSGQAVQIW